MQLQALTSVHTLKNPSNGIYITVTVCTEEYSTHLDNHPWQNVAVQVAGELVSHFKSFAHCLPSSKTGVLLLPPQNRNAEEETRSNPPFLPAHSMSKLRMRTGATLDHSPSGT